MNNYYSYQKPQFKEGTIPPIVVKLGTKQKKKIKKKIKKLKRGHGPLTEKIYRNINAIKMRVNSDELNEKTLIPFVLLVKEKAGKRKKSKRYRRLSRMMSDSGVSPVDTFIRATGLNPAKAISPVPTPAPAPEA